MSDLVGRTLGPYEIVEEIGHGGMATVYKAYQPNMERAVALKVLPREFLHDSTFLERFKREIRAIAQLEHPRILPVYEAGEVDGMPYFAMRYVEGGSLMKRIKRGPLDVGETTWLVAQIAEGLDYAHKKGVIHRDFKPSNVLLDEESNIYLGDFGIAKVSEMTAQLTGSMVIGTPAYMAPEMSEPGGLSPLVDIYALGVTLYQMLTGKQPYEADTPMGLLMAHMSKPIPDAREARPDLPDAVQTIVERAMAKDPAERYQTAGELAADLQEGVTATAEPARGPGKWLRRTKRGRKTKAAPTKEIEPTIPMREVEPTIPMEEPTPPPTPPPAVPKPEFRGPSGPEKVEPVVPMQEVPWPPQPAVASAPVSAMRSDLLEATISRYKLHGYKEMSRTGNAVVMARRAPVNAMLLIGWLAMGGVFALIYLLPFARKKYDVQLAVGHDGLVHEAGDTIETFKKGRRRATRTGLVLLFVGILIIVAIALINSASYY